MKIDITLEYKDQITRNLAEGIWKDIIWDICAPVFEEYDIECTLNVNEEFDPEDLVL